MSERRCSRCGETKPVSEFYVFKAVRFDCYCKPCRKARNRPQQDAWHRANQERYREWQRGYRERRRARDGGDG